jgi:hypothetical protein
MKTEVNEHETTVITADDGMMIMRKEDGAIVGKIAYLGNIDSPENYTEIDEPEKEEE